ncbi:MAG TPA: heme lyase CcmF/NrfE family subunit [bacterium]|nr:heme lyase CcmF/NrfE family subunit [bacterium]
MTAAIGEISAIAALLVAVAGAVSSAVALRTRNDRLVATSTGAAWALFGLVTVSAVALIYALVSNDFSIRYVAFNTTRRTPVYYKITGLWGSLEGSILLWIWMLSLFTGLVALIHRRSQKEILPAVLSVMFIVSAFFLLIAAFVASPFQHLFPVPPDGRGLNPLLEDTNMLSHPPFLYAGFVGLTVPYAFAMAALITGKLDENWIRVTRRWTLMAWLFLSIGNLIGGWWSYHVLGWGGYWAWDPVENAAFLPWLPATAFLHSVMVQERRKMLKVWNLSLIVMAFSLTIFGTFLTRSGVLSSVHAFSDGPVGIYFLSFLGIVLIASLALLAWRGDALKGQPQLDSLVSRESTLLLNNFVLVAATFTILLGTIYPLIAEIIRGVKVSVGAPYFTEMTAPLFIFLVFLMGVGPLIAWRKASLDNLRRNFLVPGATALVVGIIVAILYVRDFYPLLAITLCTFVLATVVFEFYRAIRARNRIAGEGALQALSSLFERNQRRYGGFIVHLGVVLIIMGIAVSMSYSREKEMTLKPGEGVELGRYYVQFQGMGAGEWPTHFRVWGNFQVFNQGHPLGVMSPAQRFFPIQQTPISRAVIRTSLRDDLYLVLGGFAQDGSHATVKMLLRPMVTWIWIGGVILVLGTLLAVWPFGRQGLGDEED